MRKRIVCGGILMLVSAALGGCGAEAEDTDDKGAATVAHEALTAPLTRVEMKPAANATPKAAAGTASPSALTSYATYQGGPVLQPEVVPLYWGTFTSAQITAMNTYLTNLFTYVGGSTAPAGTAPISAQYGTVGASLSRYIVADTSLPSGSISQADVLAKIQALQASSTLPPFSSERVFFVFTNGISFSDGYGRWCAYHSANGANQYYALVPYPTASGCAAGGWGSFTAPDMFNVFTSHEFFEAATDPLPFTGWVTGDSAATEIGDQCNWSYTTDNVTRLSFGAIQLEEDDTTGGCDIWNYDLAPRIKGASPATNKLDYYGLGSDKTIYHKNLNGTTWTPGRTAAWEQLGTTTFTTEPVVVTWGSKEFIFATGTDGAVRFKSFDGTTWSPSKTTWTNIGGTIFGPVAAIAFGTNQVDVYGQGPDGGYLHKSRNSSGTWLPSTPGWDTVAGLSAGAFNGGPAVARDGTGHRVIAWGPDGGYYWMKPPSTTWNFIDGPYITPPVVSSQTSTHFDVWGLGNDWAYYHNEWTGSSWIFEALGGQLATAPSAVSWSENHTDLFGEDFSGAAWRATKTTSGWTAWQAMGGVFSSGLSAAAWGTNKLDLFGVGTDLAGYHQTDTNGTWTPSSGWESFAGSFQ